MTRHDIDAAAFARDDQIFWLMNELSAEAFRELAGEGFLLLAKNAEHLDALLRETAAEFEATCNRRRDV